MFIMFIGWCGISDAIDPTDNVKNDPGKAEGEDWVSGEIKGLSGKLDGFVGRIGGKWRKLEGLTRKLEG